MRIRSLLSFLGRYSLAFILCASIQTVSFSAFSQSEEIWSGPSLQWKEWNTSSGLPSDTITSILQSQDGYLWLTAGRKLVRFDGMVFETLDPQEKYEEAKTGIFQGISSGRNGEMWISFTTGYFRYQSGRFRFFTHAELTDFLSADDPVKPDPGKVLIIMENDGPRLHRHNSDLSELMISQLKCDGERNLWIGTFRRGIKLLPSGSQEAIGIPGFPDDASIYAIIFSQNGKIWAGTDRGLYCLEYSSAAGFSSLRFYSLSSGLSSNHVTALIEDQDGVIWAGTEAGLDRIDQTEEENVQITAVLTHIPIMSLYQDIERGLWIGTRGAGLKCLRETAFRTHLTGSDETTNHFRCLFIDSSAGIWAGSRFGHLFNFRDGKFQEIFFPEDIFDQMMFVMTEDRDGILYFGTEYKGIQRFDQGRISPFPSYGGPEEGAVVSLFCDRENRIWAARLEKELGYYLEGKYIRVLDSEEYPGKMVFDFLQDSRGNLWMGSTHGLLFFPPGDIDKNRMKRRFEDTSVSTIHEDGNGTLWIGTYESGLIRLDPETWEATNLTKENGLIENSIHFIMQDNSKNFWLTSAQGIQLFTEKALAGLSSGISVREEGIRFDIPDGLASSNFSVGGRLTAVKMDDGRLIFATKNGLVSTEPSRIRINRAPLPVHIERFSVNGKPYPRPAKNSGLINIRGRDRLEIEFKAVSMADPQSLEYQYRLEGIQPEWVRIPQEEPSVAVFDRIPSGNYPLHIKAGNRHGVWNEDEIAIQIICRPLFHHTTWFRIVLTAGFLSALAILARALQIKAGKTNNKYQKTKLPKDLADRYSRELDLLLNSRHVYRDSSLTLGKLADRIEIPPHHLSQVINDRYGKNFYELINGSRIEEAKKRLREDGENQQKILAIALEVGFNSLSSFNRVFKKQTGRTPSEFRRNDSSRHPA